MSESTQVARAAVYGRQSGNKAKSIDEQIDEGLAVASENGWTVTGTYQDGRSASRYAAKGRDDWPRVLADIEAGDIDILILWESSRGDRTLTTWSQFLDLCRTHGVCIHILSDERSYDPRKAADWKSLARAGVDSAGESDVISARVKRGQAGAAVAGRPSHGRAPYGYLRVYDPTTGKLVGQEPDPDKAPIVREVFSRLAKGETLSAITRDFRERKVPTSTGSGRWFPVRVRIMAQNRAYLGERVYRGEATSGVWPALVEAEQFYAVQRILGGPKRHKTRPGRTRHLLSYIATCGPCGWPLSAVQGRYRCARAGCVTADQAATDQAVEDMILGRLSQPDVYTQLRRQGEEANRAVADMRNEVATLQARLDEWRLSAAKGETSPATMARIEGELSGQIEAAQRRIAQLDIPPELQAVLVPGQDVRVRWKAAPMAARRRIVASLAEVRLGRALVNGKLIPGYARLADSRWTGDLLTWGEKWSEADS
jgi:site-specific DNA recombinase